MDLLEKLFAGIQYLLPQHLLSRLMHAFARIRLGPVKDLQIAVFSSIAGVDWSESRLQKAAEFEHLNAFFTRELKAGARPLEEDPATLVSPADGRISECGRITTGRLLQAKGRHFSVHELLAGDVSTADFASGFFHTIYLSPRDYHRVHMPTGGKLLRTVHIPGRLFSVSPYTVRQVPNLFARNERVASIFETANGPMALVLVGAMLVSSMETVWSGVITPPRGRRITHGEWSHHDIRLERGAEMGRFNMGSTVIVLLPPGAVASMEHYDSGDTVVMGQRLGRLR